MKIAKKKCKLLRIKAPNFVVGLVLSDRGQVIRLPSIVRYMIWWPKKKVLEYCALKKWKVKELYP